jgi:hypothetical protein
MSEEGVICKLCGQPIENPKSAWREHLGWVSPIGAKSMMGARNTGELAHPECITKIRAKVSVEQTSLLAE